MKRLFLCLLLSVGLSGQAQKWEQTHQCCAIIYRGMFGEHALAEKINITLFQLEGDSLISVSTPKSANVFKLTLPMGNDVSYSLIHRKFMATELSDDHDYIVSLVYDDDELVAITIQSPLHYMFFRFCKVLSL